MGFARTVGTFYPDTLCFFAGEHGDYLMKQLNESFMGIESFPPDLSLINQLFGNNGIVFFVDIEVLTVSLSRHIAAPPCRSL